MVDYPNSTKAKKYYLCLSFECGYKTPAPKITEPSGGAARFEVSDNEHKTPSPDSAVLPSMPYRWLPMITLLKFSCVQVACSPYFEAANTPPKFT